MIPYVFLGLFALVSATKHHMFVGTFSGASVYYVEFDDEALTLTMADNITSNSAHSWIGLSYDKKSLYGVGYGSWFSYAVSNSTGLTLTNTLPVLGNCSNTRGIFIEGSKTAPYNVYAAPFGNCANVMSVDDTGALSAVVQNISYTPSSGVHGMALNANSTYLYAADDSANAIWTYAVDSATGLLSLVKVIDGPSTGSNPRHVAVHPNGKYLYAVLEEANELAQYAIDASTGVPVWQNVSYPLITPGLNDSTYWSDEVKVSPSGNYVWASSRSHDTTTNGFISAFSLSSTGAIQSQLFLTNTTTSGGSANAVAPAFFTDDFVALTDTQEQFVQIWQLKNGSTEVVATLHLGGGCCANAIWYD